MFYDCTIGLCLYLFILQIIVAAFHRITVNTYASREKIG